MAKNKQYLDRSPVILRDDLLRFYAELKEYTDKKERLTRENYLSYSLRGSTFGLLTSLFPLLSIINFLKNYGEKRGILYKFFHLFTPYKPGFRVLLPNFRAFFGARIKDWFTNRRNIQQLNLRQCNIGYAYLLLVKLDFLIHNPSATKEHHKKFKQFLNDQLQIKVARKQYDSYSVLLNKINKKITASTQLLSEKLKPIELSCKGKILDVLAKKLVPDDFKRGLDYEIERLFTGDVVESLPSAGKSLSSTYKLLYQKLIPEKQKTQTVVNVRQKSTQLSCIDKPPLIKLSPGVRKSDEMMGIQFSFRRYLDFSIQGISEDNKLVGKDNKILADGWYQFVIVNVRGAPVMRYYPCAEVRKPGSMPFIHQTVTQVEPDAEGYCTRQRKKPVLNYEKFITHSALAGGHSVYSAGAFMVKEGRVLLIDDSSGHYPVSNRSKDVYAGLKFTAELLKSYGADLSTTVLEHWKPFHGITKLCRKTGATFTYPFKRSWHDKEFAPRLAEDRPTPSGHTSPMERLIIKSNPSMLLR